MELVKLFILLILLQSCASKDKCNVIQYSWGKFCSKDGKMYKYPGEE